MTLTIISAPKQQPGDLLGSESGQSPVARSRQDVRHSGSLCPATAHQGGGNGHVCRGRVPGCRPWTVDRGDKLGPDFYGVRGVGLAPCPSCCRWSSIGPRGSHSLCPREELVMIRYPSRRPPGFTLIEL